MEKGDLIKYHFRDYDYDEFNRKGIAIPSTVNSIVLRIEEDNWLIIAYEIQNVIYYAKVKKGLCSILDGSPKADYTNCSLFKVKIKTIEDSCKKFGLVSKKKMCLNKQYSRYKIFKNKHYERLNSNLDTIIVNTEYGNLTFLLSDCEFISPNWSIAIKKDKRVKKGTNVKYVGNNKNISNSSKLVVVDIYKPSLNNNARANSIITVADELGNKNKDYKKHFKVV